MTSRETPSGVFRLRDRILRLPGQADAGVEGLGGLHQADIERMIHETRTSEGERLPARRFVVITSLLARPRTAVPGLLTYGMGAAFAGASLSSRAGVAGALISILLALVTNLHNTLTDLREDVIGLPGRARLVRQVGFRRLMMTTWVLAGSMCVLALALPLWAALFALLMVVGLFQYSTGLRAKAHPLLGLFAFAQAVCGPFLLGAFLVPEATAAWVLPLAVARVIGFSYPDPSQEAVARSAAIMLLFLGYWFTAKGCFKNLVDYDHEAAAGVRTSATIFRSRRAAGVPVLLLTGTSFLIPALLPAFAFRWQVGLASLLFIPAMWNAARLFGASDLGAANRCLKTDMLISSSFAAVLLVSLFPTMANLVLVTVGAMILGMADLFDLDSRRNADL